MSDETQMLSFKIVFLGYTHSGKTSIIQQFIKSEFDDRYERTIGASYQNWEMNMQGYPVQLNIV